MSAATRRPLDDGTEPGQRLPRVLTVDEAAQVLRISRGLAFAAIRAGEIPHLRIGRRILVPAHRLSEMLGDPSGQDSDPRPAAEPPSIPSSIAEPRSAAELRELATALEDLIRVRQAQGDLGRRDAVR